MCKKDEYVSINCDDDFLIPSAIDECLKLLDSNKDYITVFGKGSFLYFDKIMSDSFVQGIYRINSYDNDSEILRFDAILQSYSVLNYGVHRTSELVKALKNIEKINDASLKEMSVAISLAILGKSKCIEKLYLIRGIHDYRNNLELLENEILNDEWYDSYLSLRCHLVDLLLKKSSISKQMAIKKINEAFARFIRDDIVKNSNKKEKLSLIKIFKNILFKNIRIYKFFKYYKHRFMDRRYNLIELIILKKMLESYQSIMGTQ